MSTNALPCHMTKWSVAWRHGLHAGNANAKHRTDAACFWTEEADEDLAEIIGYVFERNPTAARRLWDQLKSSAVNLSDHPYLFKESERVPGYREIVAHPNYLVFYRVLDDRVQIEMVAHARRKFPVRKHR